MADVNKKINFSSNIDELTAKLLRAEKALSDLRKKKSDAAKKDKAAIQEEIDKKQKVFDLTKKELTAAERLLAIEKERLQLERERDNLRRKNQRDEEDFWSGKRNPDQTLWQKLGEKLSPTRKLGNLIDRSRQTQDAALSRQVGLTERAEGLRKLASGYDKRSNAYKALMKQAAEDEEGATKAGAEAAAAGKAGATASAALAVVNTVSRMGKEFAQNFKTVFGFSLSIKDNFADILNNVRKMLDATSGMASYNTESSLFTNAAARQTRLQYGLSGSQAYGMTQAMSMLGMKNEEDLMYMNAKQRGAFINIMEKQAAWQAKMEASGVLESIQEFQLDFEMFKQEIAVQFLQWIAENKDELMSIARLVVSVLKTILSVLAKLATLLPRGGKSWTAGSTTLSDAIAAGSVSTDNSRNLNLNQNYTINGAGDNPNNYLGVVQNWADMTAKQTAAAMN